MIIIKIQQKPNFIKNIYDEKKIVDVFFLWLETICENVTKKAIETVGNSQTCHRKLFSVSIIIIFNTEHQQKLQFPNFSLFHFI